MYVIFLTGSAYASALVNSQTNCDLPGCSFDSGAYFLDVQAMPPAPSGGGNYGVGHTETVSATYEDDLILMITGGPQQGFVEPCFTGSGDTYDGQDLVGGSFLGQSAPTPGSRAFSFTQCGGGPPASYTLGVPIESPLDLSASVLTSGPYPQAFADISFTGFQFFDASMTPITGVTYSLVEVPTPEPSNTWLLLCLLIVGVTVLHKAPTASRRGDR